jgi:hypothetical protein
MRIAFLIVAVGLLLSGIVSAQARLGETEDQCITRYGTPIHVLNPGEILNPGDKGALYRTLIFIKGDYVVVIYLLNGKCSFLSVQRTDKVALGDGEIELLLSANIGGLTWQKTSANNANQYWVRTDGAEAKCSLDNLSLTFYSKDILAAEHARHQANEAKSLNGF